MAKKRKNQYKPAKKGKAGAIWGGILIGAVGIICAGAIVVSVASAINGVPMGEQIVNWAGGIMPPAETVTPTV